MCVCVCVHQKYVYFLDFNALAKVKITLGTDIS